MFRYDQLVKPKAASIILSFAIAISSFVIQMYSLWGGYILALVFLLNMILASLLDSFWPTRGKKENPIVFGLFWGLILGLLVPFLTLKYLSELFI
ncbi:MAG: hypothetical protein HWE27_14350 [Gammaproteobacteria bacterium]|nr:hypothetical protein [Gammaproteobacteria bacterium]